jgi:hypothetical protein
MRPTENFKTSDIDLSAAIMTATGIAPDIDPGSRENDFTLAEFSFPDTDPVQKIVLRYAGGNLSLPVVRFARNRACLFRRMRKAIESGKRLRSPVTGVRRP